MTNLELAICEAENSGEIDLDTRDVMLGILNEATRQAKESRIFNTKYITPLYRKKRRLEADERKAYVDMENSRLTDRYANSVEKWKVAKKELDVCKNEIRIAEQKRDKIDKYGDLGYARHWGKVQAKINAGDDILKRAWDSTTNDGSACKEPKDLGRSFAEHSRRQQRSKRYERPSGIYKKANTVNESSIDDIEIYNESTASSRRCRELDSEERRGDKKLNDYIDRTSGLLEVYKNEGNEKMVAAVEKRIQQLDDEVIILAQKRWRIYEALDKANEGKSPSYRKGKYLPGNLDDETKARLNDLRNNKRKKELGEILNSMKPKYEQALKLKKEVSKIKLMIPSKRKSINTKIDNIINEYKKTESEYNKLVSPKQESVLEEIYEAELCGDITPEERAVLIDYLND